MRVAGPREGFSDMAGGKKARRKAPPWKDEVRAAARDVLEILREVPGIDLATTSDIDSKLLISPTFNCRGMVQFIPAHLILWKETLGKKRITETFHPRYRLPPRLREADDARDPDVGPVRPQGPRHCQRPHPAAGTHHLVTRPHGRTLNG